MKHSCPESFRGTKGNENPPEGRRTQGLAVAGGPAVFRLLTLYITTVVYYYMDEFQEKVSVLFSKGRARTKD